MQLPAGGHGGADATSGASDSGDAGGHAVVAQTLHLEQVTNNSFRNHFGSF